METLQVTLVQSDIIWENPEANRAHLYNLLVKKGLATDIIVLPEMFSTGFTMQPQSVAEPPNGPTSQWMQVLSERFNALVIGSIVVVENDQYYNRLIAAAPSSEQLIYNKRHLFRMADEHLHYQAGTERLIFDYKEWKICPMICYDLRFPVWSCNKGIAGGLAYDLLIYVANWPERRSSHWRKLLAARAIENQAYVVGVNRVGLDNQKINHRGDSMAIDYLGETLTEIIRGEGVETVALDYKLLSQYRYRFPVWQDADNFVLY
jgi:predicted amidohydrolase